MSTFLNLKDLTDALTATTESHAQVQMCRWGVISDVSNPKDGLPPSYPYIFYIIDSVNTTRRQYFVNITGIFQTRCEDTQDGILQAQSDMAEIARDIYAQYIIQSGSGPAWSISKDVQIQGFPFVERFQDTVAGVTVTWPFEIDFPISKCYFPYKTP